MTGAAGVAGRTPAAWDAAAFERAFPSDRLDGLRPRSRADAPLEDRGPLAAAWAAGRAVTVDLPDAAESLHDLAAAARALAPQVDGVVLRERDEPGVGPAPSYAATVVAAIVPVVVELSCRDRNRVALEGEVAALADGGAAAILVSERTGGVDDLDAADLVALARRAGAVVVVDTTDAARPADLAAAGAHVRWTSVASRSGGDGDDAEEAALPDIVVIDPSAPTGAWPGGASVHLSGAGLSLDALIAAATRVRELRP